MELANLFWVVADLDRSRAFYDLLLGAPGQLRGDSLRYSIQGLELRFYALSPTLARDFRLRRSGSREKPRQGLCLKDADWSSRLASLEAAGARWEVPWGPAPWGGWMAHLSDRDGYRWEIASPASLEPAPANTHHDGPREASRRD